MTKSLFFPKTDLQVDKQEVHLKRDSLTLKTKGYLDELLYHWVLKIKLCLTIDVGLIALMTQYRLF